MIIRSFLSKNKSESGLALSFGFLIWFALSALRLIYLNHESLWFDELGTYYLSTRPFFEILRVDTAHPPLMAIALYCWTKLTQSIDPFTLKFLPFIFGQLTLAMFFKVLRFHTTLSYAALGTALFLCFDSTFYFLSELRSYSITPFFFLGFYYYYHLKRRPTAALFFFVTGIYTHYTLLLVFGLIILGSLIKYKKAYILEALFFLSSLPALYLASTYLLDDHSYYWRNQEHSVLKASYNFLAAFLTSGYNYGLEVYLSFPLFILTLLGAFIYTKRRSLSSSYPLLIGITTPFILILLLDFGPYQSRFYQATLASYALSITIFFSSLKKQKLAQLIMGALILALSLRYFNIKSGFFSHHRKPQWEQAIHKLSQATTSKKRIYVFANATTSFNIFKYYNDLFFNQKEVVIYRGPEQMIMGLKNQLTNYAIYQKPTPVIDDSMPFTRKIKYESAQLSIFELIGRYH